MALATWQDVQTALGRPISDSAEQQRVEWWLNGAEVQIKARLGDVALLDQDAVVYVETEAVAAKVVNPDGLQSETVDDYTYRFGSQSRAVTITEDWWALLRSADGFSTRPGFTPDTTPANLLDWS